MVLIALLGLLFAPCLAYIDLGHLQDNTPDYIPRIPTPRPWMLPPNEDADVAMLPSMITAIAPSTTMASNGTFETMYSMHYHNYFVKSRKGKGIFKRGVFASDAPIATCTPCGYQGTSTPTNATAATTGSPTASCTLHTYLVRIQSPGKEDGADMSLGRLPLFRRDRRRSLVQLLLRLELLWGIRDVHNLNHWSTMLLYNPGFVPIERQCEHVLHIHNRSLPI